MTGITGTSASDAPRDASRHGDRSLLGVATAVGLGLLGASTIIGSLQLGMWSRLGPGAGFFPFWLGIALTAAAAVWGRQQWRGEAGEDVDEGEEANGTGRIVAMVGSIVAAALLLELLGFQLTILLFLLFHLRVLHRVRWIVAVPIILVGSLGVFTLFDFLLSVHLPTSSLPFLAAIGL